MDEVAQQEYVLVGGAWLYPKMNVANTVHSGNSYFFTKDEAVGS